MNLYIGIMTRVSVLMLLLVIPVMGFSQADTNLVWPRPPDRPRVKYIETISSQQPFKQESGGFFSKITSFLFGEHKEPLWFVQPVGIAVSPDGIIYVADPGAHGVHAVNRAKKEYDFLSRAKSGNFLSPVGIAIASDGTIYVSDSERGEIIVLDKDHDPQYAFKDSLLRPTGINIFFGKIYVVDSGRHKVLIFDLHGKYLGEFGGRGSGDGEFNFPVAAAGSNVMYVVDALNYRIQEFDPNGKFLFKFGRQGNAPGAFASPKSVALDSDGNIYVTDALMDIFQIFNNQGQLLLVVGQRGDRAGEFMSPGGIASDSNDNVYIIDMLNKRIQIFRYLK